MWTDDEIVNRIQARKAEDIFGFEWFEYAVCLPFEKIKSFLKQDPEMTAAKWDSSLQDRSSEAMKAKMLDYMSFAWDKANDKCGLSAGRSIMHYIAWTWLAGDLSLSAELEEDYVHYGKPHLIKICEHYGWDWKQWDDGVRTKG